MKIIHFTAAFTGPDRKQEASQCVRRCRERFMKGETTVRTFQRTIRAGGAVIQCTIVVARQEFEPIAPVDA